MGLVNREGQGLVLPDARERLDHPGIMYDHTPQPPLPAVLQDHSRGTPGFVPGGRGILVHPHLDGIHVPTHVSAFDLEHRCDLPRHTAIVLVLFDRLLADSVRK